MASLPHSSLDSRGDNSKGKLIMNIIRPGDHVFISVPVGHVDRAASEQFQKGFKHFLETVEAGNAGLTVTTSTVGAVDSSPEVMFVVRRDTPKTCLCE